MEPEPNIGPLPMKFTMKSGTVIDNVNIKHLISFDSYNMECECEQN